MKLLEMKCKNCGALLKVEEDAKYIECQYCNTKYKLDDEVQHIKYDDMEKSGYEFEKGRIRAQQEQKRAQSNYNNLNNVNNTSKKKNNKTFWLILAWIFLLPFTATYFIAKNNKLDKKKKIVIIAIMWVIFLVIAYANPSENIKDTQSNNQNQTETHIEDN
mgnify:FL=1|jgi:hypothetical protein